MKNAKGPGRRVAELHALAVAASVGLGLAGGAVAQVSEPKVETLLVTPVTCPPKPPPDPCEILTCKGGEWVSTYKAIGVACDDGDPCTYNDKCVDTIGSCAGTVLACVPRGPCETSTCNGTSECTVAAKTAGTTCGYLPGDPTEPSNPCGSACDGASFLCQP